MFSKTTHIACNHCDLLIKVKPLKNREHASCPRCRQLLYLSLQSFNTSIALLITAFLVYIPMVALPFLGLEVTGQTHEISLITSITEIATGKLTLLAGTVFLLVLFFPLVKILGLLLIIVPLSKQRLPFFGNKVIYWILLAASWGMIEVYFVGVLVTLIKLSGVASISLLGGFYLFILLMILDGFINLALPTKRIWQAIVELHEKPDEQGHNCVFE